MRPKIDRLVVATQNTGKMAEIKAILKSLNCEILSLRDIKGARDIDIKETGLTFYENSLIKAQAVYEMTNIPALADDSGLCVKYLDGMPGVFSARFSGDGATDAKNNKKLLSMIKGVPEKDRAAYFKCAATLVFGKGRALSATGIVKGYIATAPKGSSGFGYDPIFYLPAYDKTMAQLPADTKNRISHRYKALMNMRSKMLQLSE